MIMTRPLFIIVDQIAVTNNTQHRNRVYKHDSHVNKLSVRLQGIYMKLR